MGSVDIPKEDSLKKAGIKTYEGKKVDDFTNVKKIPDSISVGNIPIKNPTGFFSDPTDKRFGGKIALESPKTFSDIYKSSFNDLYYFGRSVSSFKGKVEDWEKVQQEVMDVYGIEIPHFLDYIPEIDDKFRKIPFFSVDGVGVQGQAPYKEKIKYIENLIKDIQKKHPQNRPEKFMGYEHYFDLRKQKAAETQGQLALNMQYADSGWDKWGGMLSGTAVASFHDPVILATLPLSMLYGWQGGIVYAAMRTAAIEAVIAAGAETVIQTQVVPYRQSLGQDYTWSDAAKIIGTVSLASGVFAGTLTTGVKGSAQLYKNAQMALAKTDPEIRNKIIGKEFEKLVDQGADPDLLLQYMKDRISELPPNEMIMLFKSFPNSIQTHTPYANALKNLEDKVAEDIDNPLSKNIEGEVEHMERTNSALESVLKNEELTIPEQPVSTIVINEKRPVMNHVKLKPDQIKVDAEVFQFKTGGDSLGVLETLRGVKKWDDVAAGTLMVWERADGKYFIADGHQRLGLAKKLSKKQKVVLNTQIRREVDGWTSQDVMVEAMTVNIVAGTARAADVSRMFLKIGEASTAQRLIGRIKPTQALYQNALGLYKLGDDGFRYWLKGGIKDYIAAQVGHLIDDPQLTINILKILEKTKPANMNEARAMIISAVEAGIVKTEQIDMFGKTVMKQSLIVERAKVYDRAVRELKKDKTIFKALVENDESIVKSGRNKLDTDYNIEKAEQYGILIYKIEKLANRKGQLSDELTAAAKLWKDGSKRKAVESFKKAIYESVERGDHEGLTPSGSERTVFASQSESPARQKPKENIITEKLKVHDDPHDTNVIVKEADDQLDELTDEIKSGAASGERKTSDTLKPLDRTQEEFFQTTTAEPPSSVLAKAKGTPSASRILEDNLIGDVKTVSGINHKILQISDSVDNLYKLANKNISNIEASITNIAIKFKNAKFITNIKKKSELKRKLKQRQDDFGKDYDIRFIGDIARGRIILENLEEVVDGLSVEGWLRKNFKVVHKKDYFKTPKESGYRAAHYQLVTEDGLAFELQVHHKDLLKIYNQLRDLPNSAYKKYKNRKLTEKEEIIKDKLVAREKKIFDDAWSEIQVKQKKLPEQRAMDIGLFDATARNQLDLTDEITIIKEVDGEEVADTKTLKQVLDDVEEDDKIINFLKDCPGIS